ncbi:hypothetical protein ACS0TY_017948 [Phlomoides rotata]
MSRLSIPKIAKFETSSPMGRNSNQAIITEGLEPFQAEFLGFDEFIPSFATANDTKILKGVNYVSGSAGILDDTGRAQGDRITMKKQLNLYKYGARKIGVFGPGLAGIRNTTGSCCISTSDFTGLCDADKSPCNERKEYAFWDEYASSLMARRAYNSSLSSDAYPYDIFHLVQQI